MNEAVQVPIEIGPVKDADPYIERSAKYIERMEKEGYVVVTPGRTEVQVDIDSKEQYAVFLKQLDALEKRGSVARVIMTISKSGGRHFRVFLHREINKVERIAIQAALGSDPLRELLSMFQYWDGDPIPSLMAERKEAEQYEITYNSDLLSDFFNFKGVYK